MRKALLTLVGFAVSATCVSSASAGAWFTKKVGPGSSVYIRSAPQTFVIGTLFDNDKFTYNTDNSSGDYRWGHARGYANKCGWANINYLQPTTIVHTSDCTPAQYNDALGKDGRIFLLALYARCMNDYVPNQLGGVQPFFENTSSGTWQQTVPLGAPFPMHGNYNYTTYAVEGPVVGHIQPGQGLIWRWVSDNSGVILGKLNDGSTFGEGTWGFVPRYVMPPDLRYWDYYPPLNRGITRTDNQGGNG